MELKIKERIKVFKERKKYDFKISMSNTSRKVYAQSRAFSINILLIEIPNTNKFNNLSLKIIVKL